MSTKKRTREEQLLQQLAEWRHVGLYMDEHGATKALLIDLGSAKRITAGKARQAEREMLAKLGL